MVVSRLCCLAEAVDLWSRVALMVSWWLMQIGRSSTLPRNSWVSDRKLRWCDLTSSAQLADTYTPQQRTTERHLPYGIPQCVTCCTLVSHRFHSLQRTSYISQHRQCFKWEKSAWTPQPKLISLLLSHLSLLHCQMQSPLPFLPLPFPFLKPFLSLSPFLFCSRPPKYSCRWL